MRAAILTPYDGTEEIEISSDLSALQEFVGGYIEHVPVPGRSDVHIWANEDGLSLQLPYNHEASRLAGRFLVGTVLLCGCAPDGEDTDLPADWQVV